MSWFRNIKNKLFGDWSTPSAAYYNLSGRRTNNSSWIKNGTPYNEQDSFLSGINNFFNKISSDDIFTGLLYRATGAGLTPAEREANVFNAEQSEIAFNRELDASNTQYQRRVADLTAAGINPIMAVSQGVSLPSAAVASSVSPASAAFQLPSLMQMIKSMKMMDVEMSNLKAQTSKIYADTEKTKEDTKATQISNKYLDERERLINEGQSLANKLSEENIKKVDAEIDNARQTLKKLIAETKNEEERYNLILAEIMAQNANTQKIVEMLPFEKAYMSANTEAARASAAAQFAQAAWQNGLIDNGMIGYVVEEQGYKRDSAEYNSAIDRVRSQISGDTPTNMGKTGDMILKAFGKLNHMLPKLF